MGLKEQITAIANRYISDPSHFIVDVIIGGNKGLTKVTILVDGDDGITIDDCALISRKVGGEIESDNIIENAYILEVSSPGVDLPLNSLRQYKKNIGRKVEVNLADKKILKGKLEAVTEEKITLLSESKKGKLVVHTSVEIPFNNILKTNILVSFN